MTAGSAPARSSGVKGSLKKLVRAGVPLPLRKGLAVLVQRLPLIEGGRRDWWSVELVRDLAQKDADSFHEFLWTHHIGYAATYEVGSRFGPENMKASRRMFFADLHDVLERAGRSPSGIRSVFEVGCSLGYQLRYLETDVCPRADALEGVDIDRYAVESGSAYLRAAGSRVALRVADMRELDGVLAGRFYDVIICTGVLMYLTQQAAAGVVAVMLRHARLVAIAGLAHTAVDNADLPASDTRPSDATFVHNIDAMVKEQGGTVLFRRWEGARNVDGNTIYFVFASGSHAC